MWKPTKITQPCQPFSLHGTVPKDLKAIKSLVYTRKIAVATQATTDLFPSLVFAQNYGAVVYSQLESYLITIRISSLYIIQASVPFSLQTPVSFNRLCKTQYGQRLLYWNGFTEFTEHLSPWAIIIL